jgi:beta-glucosidase
LGTAILTPKKSLFFPFGHGPSYTRFADSDLKVNEQSISFTIKNIGEVAGEEIAQVYIKPLSSSVFRANKELKGFAKVHLGPGESKQVTIDLDDHAFTMN